MDRFLERVREVKAFREAPFARREIRYLINIECGNKCRVTIHHDMWEEQPTGEWTVSIYACRYCLARFRGHMCFPIHSYHSVSIAPQLHPNRDYMCTFCGNTNYFYCDIVTHEYEVNGQACGNCKKKADDARQQAPIKLLLCRAVVILPELARAILWLYWH